MISLLLVAALCTDTGCTYMDTTSRFKVQSDEDCAQMANFLNQENRVSGTDPRFACLEPSKYRALVTREL